MIFSLLTLPIDGFKFVLNTVIKVAQEQYTDDAPLKERLLELQVRLENEEITEEEYIAEEAEVLRSLREIRERKREMAGLPPEDEDSVFSGEVKEGSGASVTFDEEAAGEESGPAPAAISAPRAARAIRGSSPDGGRRAPRRNRRGR